MGVCTRPGAMQFTLPFGAILTISFLSDKVSPYIIACVTNGESPDLAAFSGLVFNELTAFRGSIIGKPSRSKLPSCAPNKHDVRFRLVIFWS